MNHFCRISEKKNIVDENCRSTSDNESDGMADPASYGNPDRDIEQALIALKRGTQLIKYSRKGKPKFRTFRLSPDETTLIWYSHGSERHLILSSVSRITPGQRTPVFRRFLRPEKEYLSFSLIYSNGERSLDLICKDKVESEVWLAGLKSLISTAHPRSRRSRSDIFELQSVSDISQDNRPSGAALEYTSSIPRGRLSTDSSSRDKSPSSSSHVSSETVNMLVRTSGADGFRISVSSTPSCSSQGSGPDDIESLGDVYVWGEIWSDGVATDGIGKPIPIKTDVCIPKPLESNVVLDVHQIACGIRHVALVTRQGEVFTWGEESGGRLGHGIEKDISCPQLVEFLSVTSVDFVSCAEFHTCALSSSGDIYTWGDGTHSAGLLGHGNDVSHWIPKRISGTLEGHQVLSVACGTWHTALATSTGKLFTFGDGTFGALGHGNRESVSYPKEVQSLRGLKAVAVSCGVWHTSAIIEIGNQAGAYVSSRKLFTWGDGDKNRLGHGNKDTYLVPECVSGLIDYNIHQLACGHNITVALTTSGHVFTVGSKSYGQLGNPQSEGKSPTLVQDRLVGEFVEQIACGAHHIAVLTSRSEMFTWGRGANGRLGHGDFEDRNVPTLVEALKDKHVKNIACGSNFTASICIHKWVSGADQSVCTGCRQAFGFTRKRHNCYNCGQVHCHSCSSKKALKAALAPTPGKPHRVCDACYLKLKKAGEVENASISRRPSGHRRSMDMSARGTRGEVRTSRILLSPTVEPIKYLEIKSGRHGMRSDNYSIVRASQVPSLMQLKDIAFPSSLSALQYALKPVVTSGPQSQQLYQQTQSNSRPSSPYSRRPSPPRSATPIMSRGVVDSLKKTNDILSQEVSKLHSQIKCLKHKSEDQDIEIQKLKKTAQEAALMVSDRSSKNLRAMQAVRTITDQLVEITERLPPEIYENESFKVMRSHVESILHIIGTQAYDDTPGWSQEQIMEHQNHDYETSATSTSESNIIDDHRTGDHNDENLPQTMDENQQSSINGSSERTLGTGPGISKDIRTEGQKEVIEQFEPGVYVTVYLLANGTKIFKRVRFSKRRFSAVQAEAWWKGNKDRLLRRYTPQRQSNEPSEALQDQPSLDETDNHETQENTKGAQFS